MNRIPGNWATSYFAERFVGFSTTVVRGLRAAVAFETYRPVTALRACPVKFDFFVVI